MPTQDTASVTTDVVALADQYASDIPRDRVESGDAESVSAAIAQRILDAETPEQLAHMFDDRSSDPYLGTTFEVKTFTLHESSRFEGQSIYATVVTDRGEFTIGARGVIVTLIAMHRRGWLPLPCTLRTAQTSNGTTVKNLVPVIK